MFFLIGSVALGWHYAIDGYAAILITCALWAIVGWALRVRRDSPIVNAA
jgi:hypothetical protein